MSSHRPVFRRARPTGTHQDEHCECRALTSAREGRWLTGGDAAKATLFEFDTDGGVLQVVFETPARAVTFCRAGPS